MTREQPTMVSRHLTRPRDRWITVTATLLTWIVAGVVELLLIVGLVLALVW